MIQKTDIDTTRDQSLNAVFDCLANGVRRHLLGRLVERAPHSVSRRDLARSLVQNERIPQLGNTDADLQQAHRALYHTHLPKLAAAGLINRETDRETVAITDHPAFEDAGIIAAIESESGGGSDSLDGLFRGLRKARRRTILRVLSNRQRPIPTETLARTVGAKEQETAESEVRTEDIDRILVDLVHCHLPALAEAGLVTYDSGDGMVAYEGHPQMTVPWMHSVFAPEFRRRLTGES